MGRRPKQIVFEHFDRGAKLEDKSNRYEYRCKACGEHFPKGRIETLFAHIEKRCSNVGRGQNGAASSPNDQSSLNELGVNGNTVSNQHNGQTFTQRRVVLPVNGSRSLTGLEALAEASRQLEHPRNSEGDQTLQSHLIDPDLQRPSSIFRHSGFGAGSGDAGRTYHRN